MKNLRIYAVLVLFLGLLFNGTAFAQQVSGTVVGQVTDQSGAAVPGAALTLKALGTGVTRQATSNSSGEYSFQATAVGKYTLDVAAPSFKGYTANNVTVNVASITRVDAKLSAGSVSETVQVSADAVQVNTDSGALGALVDGTQVKELPLNGRSFVELTQLTPGVSAANNFDSKNKGLQGGVDFSVNGNPTTNNLFLVDGANDNDTGSNRTILIYPSIDAIAEFKMLTNSYGAEYGQASGAIISIATRSGTNKFHGSAFFDGRNDALASYTYFARRNAGKGQPLNGKDKLRRSDWGGSLGGPIFRDKLFFFGDVEWNHEIRGYTQSSCVPSAAERAGDFTNTSCGSQPSFPVALQKGGNPHILNAVDPAGALLGQYFPLPNQTPSTPGGNNWSQSLPTFLKYHQYSGRVDYNLTQHNLIMGKYTQDGWTNPSYNGNQYWGDSAFPVINGNWAQPSKQIVARWTSTISDSLVNDAEFAYSGNRINVTPGGTNAGLLGQLSAAIPSIYPESLKTAKASTPTVWGGLGAYGDYGTNIWSLAPWNNALDIYTLRDDVSKVAGHHALKIGAFAGYSGKNEDSSAASNERPTFVTYDGAVATKSPDTVTGINGVATGNNLANVLIPGNPFNLNENSTNIHAQLRWKDFAAYVDDTYKVTPRLTLNLGVRYEIIGPTYQPNNQLTNFQPNLYDPNKPASDACNGLLIAPGTDPCGAANAKFGTSYSHGTPFSNRYLVNTNYHLISPRLGLAYDVFGNGTTAIRAGFGEFYQRERVSRYQLVNNAPFTVNSGNVIRALGGASVDPKTLAGSASPGGGFDTSNTIPSSFQYNLTVEQELAKNTDLQISYVGNRGEHLTSSYDVNGVTPANYFAATFAPGSATQSYRAFPHDNNTIAFFTHNGDSYYNSLQVALKTQITSAFRLGAAYTWSHGISDVPTDDSSGGTGAQSFTIPTNPRFDRGNSTTNRPNIFVTNVTYFAPKLDGHNFAERETLGGWEVTAISSAESGNSFTIYQGGVNDAAHSTLGALFQSGLTGNQRPLINPGQTCSSGGIGGDQVINPNAFTLIGYHLGTVDPHMAPRGYCHGPHLVNTDLSLDKNWKVHDLVTVQFRLDAFDVFNHANFRADQIANGTPFSSINCGPSIQVAGATTYNPCSTTNNVVTHQTQGSNFGRSNGLVGNAERQFQYALHLEF